MLTMDIMKFLNIFANGPITRSMRFGYTNMDKKSFLIYEKPVTRSMVAEKSSERSVPTYEKPVTRSMTAEKSSERSVPTYEKPVTRSMTTDNSSKVLRWANEIASVQNDGRNTSEKLNKSIEEIHKWIRENTESTAPIYKKPVTRSEKKYKYFAQMEEKPITRLMRAVEKSKSCKKCNNCRCV